MSKFFTNHYPIINLYKKKSAKSEVVTQMIFGESFKVLDKTNKWLKIKIKEDNYKGFIKLTKFEKFIKATHKIDKLKAPFLLKNKKKGYLTFGSKIKADKKVGNYFNFGKYKIKASYLKPIKFKQKDYFSKIKIFRGVKYKWGGKSYKGIDCSALIQVCLNFNNKYCPRDAKDQVKYFKKNIKLKNIRKNNVIYWKGHVAVALSKNKLIHAYGPMKKTVVMNTNQTIKRIYKTANLKVIGIKQI